MSGSEVQLPKVAGGGHEPSAAGIGATLRLARERRGVTQLQAAEQLRVDVAVIAALEEERFDRLGAPVFARGHLHRYAQFLGESEAPLQEQYAALEGADLEPDLTQAPRVTGRQPPRVRAGEALPRLLWPLLLCAGVVVLAGIVWLGLAARAAAP
jgi:cytoskeleton protein RodZ